MGDAQRVLDGDLDGFVRAELLRQAGDGERELARHGRRAARQRAAAPRPTSTRSSATASAAPARFHVPGHKGGPGADPGLRHAIGERRAAARRPAGHPRRRRRPVADAVRARRAARRRGLRRARARGSSRTARRRATMRSASRSPRSARRVVAQRNSHASVVDGLVLSAAGVPTFVAPEYDAGARHGARRHAGGARAPRSTRTPGRARGVHRLADVLRHGRRRRRAARRSRTPRASPLVVDQSWGAHFGFHPDLPAERAAARRRRRPHEHAQDRRLADAERDAARRPGRPGGRRRRVARAVRLVRSTSPSLAAPGARSTPRAASSRSTARQLLHETIARHRRGAREAARAIDGVELRRPGARRPPRRRRLRPAAHRPRRARARAAPGYRALRRAAPELRRARRAGDAVDDRASSSGWASARGRCCGSPATSRRRSRGMRRPGRRDRADLPAAPRRRSWRSRRATRSSATPSRSSTSTTPSGASRASRSPATRRASRRCCRASAISEEIVRYLTETVAVGRAAARGERPGVRHAVRAARGLTRPLSGRAARACRRRRRPRSPRAAARPSSSGAVSLMIGMSFPSAHQSRRSACAAAGNAWSTRQHAAVVHADDVDAAQQRPC